MSRSKIVPELKFICLFISTHHYTLNKSPWSQDIFDYTGYRNAYSSQRQVIDKF